MKSEKERKPPSSGTEILLQFIGMLTLGGLFVTLGWNYGIVPVAEASGAVLDGINYWAGLFTALALMSIRGLLLRGSR